MAEGEDENAAPPPASKEEAAVGKAMDNLAGGGTEKAMDSSKADAAVAKLQETRAKEKADLKKRAQELAKVQVSKEDVKVVAHEFDLDLKAADAKLREHDGDLRSALVSLVNDGLDSEC